MAFRVVAPAPRALRREPGGANPAARTRAGIGGTAAKRRQQVIWVLGQVKLAEEVPLMVVAECDDTA